MARTLKAVLADSVPPTGGTTVAKNNLATAITNISAKVEQVNKNGRNTHFSYNFAKAPDVTRALKDLMHEYGVIITQSETDCQMLTPEVMRCCYDFIIEHVPSGETKTLKSSGMSKVTGDKRGFNDGAIQAIATTTRKYVLIGLFNLIVDDMPDVDAQGEGKPKTLTKQQAAGTFKQLGDDLRAITNLGDLEQFGNDNGVCIATLPEEWQKVLRLRYVEKLNALKGAQAKPLTIVASPKSTLKPAVQQGQGRGPISQRAINSRAQRLQQAQQIGAVESEVEGPFDENPF